VHEEIPLSRRRFILLAFGVVFLGVMAHLPSFGVGFYGDDHIHQLVLEGWAPQQVPLRPWNLYDFGTAEQWTAAAGHGVWNPIWWLDRDWKIRFIRPVASLSLWLDHALWGSNPSGYHATSVAWYALLLVLVLSMYRSIGCDCRAALLATAFYTATNGAALPVGWIANRNMVLASVATVAAALAVATLRPPWRLPSALLLAGAAATCRESGVVAFLLVAGWLALEAVRNQGESSRRSWLGVGTAAVCAPAALMVLAACGAGTRSVFYATPWVDPVRYLANLGTLFSAGLLRLVAPVSLDLQVFDPGLRLVLSGVGVLVAWPLAAVVAQRVRTHPAAPFLALWLVGSLLLEGAAPPWDRLLFQAAVGSAGLLALFVCSVLDTDLHSEPRRRRVLAWLVVASAGVLSLLNAAAQSTAVAVVASNVRRAVASVDPGPALGCTADALVLQASNGLIPFVLPSSWLIQTGRSDVRVSAFQLGRRGLVWTREDDRTCLFRSTGEPFLTSLYERVYRSDLRPPRAGHVYHGQMFTAEVVEVAAAGPTALRLRFDRSLDADDLRFLAPVDDRLAPVTPPPIGATMTLPEVAYDSLLQP
jgi:hypothetical protein